MASGRSDAAGRRSVLRLLAAALAAVAAAAVTRRLPGRTRANEGTKLDPPGREARFWRRL
jgi:hypothetical protein